jgi:hypothetical protein
VNNPTARTAAATWYTTQAPWVALTSTVPGASAGTELTGGSPAYARVASNWSAASGGASTATPAAQNVASGSTVAGAQFMSASTAGTYFDGGGVTSQTFSSQGTYQLTATITFS